MNASDLRVSTRTAPAVAPRRRALRALASTLLCALGLAAASPLPAQGITGEQQKRARRILEQLQKELEKRYYDPTFGGTDLAGLLEEIDVSVQGAQNEFHMFALIAQYLLRLEDSHTVFYPPTYVSDVDYGFELQFVGDTCFVVKLDEESDGARSGLKLGDAVLALDGIPLERRSFWVIEYLYNVLTPRARVRLTAQSPGAAPRDIEVFTKVTEREGFLDMNNPDHRRLLEERSWRATRDIVHHLVQVSDSARVWKLPLFAHQDQRNINDMIKAARRGHTLILDLRDNQGGAVRTLQYLLARLFDREVDVATLNKRDGSEVLRAKPSKDAFPGKLIVLVDSRSASAAEIVARVVQLEGRGTVLGDRTAGAVMTSEFRVLDIGFSRTWVYGASITVADVVMRDGGRLEKVGVTPDELIVPTGEDLAAGRDPVMARALELAGVPVGPEEAGRIYERR